jgi:hypothetical protein
MGRPLRPRVDDILSEVAVLSDSLRAVIDRSSGSPPEEKELWLIYAGTERAVAKLKYRLGVERPGVFSELPKSKSPEEFLTRALDSFRDAGTKMRDESLIDGLEALRAARTYLRAFLAELLRVRMREKRKAALSRRSSSPSS